MSLSHSLLSEGQHLPFQLSHQVEPEKSLGSSLRLMGHHREPSRQESVLTHFPPALAVWAERIADRARAAVREQHQDAHVSQPFEPAHAR